MFDGKLTDARNLQRTSEQELMRAHQELHTKLDAQEKARRAKETELQAKSASEALAQGAAAQAMQQVQHTSVEAQRYVAASQFAPTQDSQARATLRKSK